MHSNHVLFDFPYFPLITQEYCHGESNLYLTFFFFLFHVHDRLMLSNFDSPNHCVSGKRPKGKARWCISPQNVLKTRKIQLPEMNTENDVSANKSPKWSWRECKFVTFLSLSSSWLFNYAHIIFLFKTTSLCSLLYLLLFINRTLRNLPCSNNCH